MTNLYQPIQKDIGYDIKKIRYYIGMKRWELFFSFVLLSLFFGFTLIVKHQYFEHIDLDVTVKVQDHIPHSFDTIFSIFSLIGSAEVISLFLLPPLFFFYKFWRSIVILVGYGFGLFIEVIGKTFLSHSGPPHFFFRYDLGFNFPSSYIETLHSYPSGHSYRTLFVVYVWFVYLFETVHSKSIRALIFLISSGLCAIMLVSRVCLGEHWTSDVIGGALLGLGLAMASCAFRKLPQQVKKIRHEVRSTHS